MAQPSNAMDAVTLASDFNRQHQNTAEKIMTEWFEDESFWIETYPFMFSEEKFKAAVEEVDKILQLIDLKGTAILDLCCGPGRYSVELAKRGLAVTGVDRSPFLLDKAKARAKAEGVGIEWIQQDMREFVRSEAYDFVLSMFTSFGYFDNKDDDLRVLYNILSSLKPGGIFLIDVMGKERLARIFQPTTSEKLPDGSLLVQRHEIFDDWTRVRNEWIVMKDGEVQSFKFHHTIYSGQELRDRLEGVGFREVKLFANLDGKEYGLDAQRLIAVGKKVGG